MRAFLLAALIALIVPSVQSQSVRFGPDEEVQDPNEVRVLRILSTTRVSLEFEETPLPEVLRFLQEVTGVNLVLDPRVSETLSEEDLQVTLQLEDLPVSSVLKLLLDLKGLRQRYRDGIVLITTAEAAQQEVYFRIYDVHDIMYTLPDFPGPDITLAQADNSSGNLLGITMQESSNSLFEDPDTLVDLITQNVSPDTWDLDRVSISLHNGLLIITQSREVQREVARFLDLLRSYR